MSDNSYLSFTEFVEFCGRSTFAVEGLVNDGLTPPVYFRNSTRWFLRADAEAWQKSNGLCRSAVEWNAAKLHFAHP